MKKIIFTLGILVSGALSAQIYTQAGGLISGTGGNVGINNLSPSARLDINNSVRIAPYESGSSLGYQSTSGSDLMILNGDIYSGNISSSISFGGKYYNQGVSGDAVYNYLKWSQGALKISNNQQDKIIVGGGDEWANQNVIINPTGGNVGIGTVTPHGKLDVNGNSHLLGPGRKIYGNSNPVNYYIGSYPVTGSDGLDIHWFGGIKFGTSAGDIMKLNQTGQVEIGAINLQSSCTDCNDYKLFVEDGIRTEQVKVDIAANNGWADYVFKDDYKLRTLDEVEGFIAENGHLPEVPSEKEAIENGIELKAMNILLLKKIEELTLYTIDQQKRIEALEAEMKSSK